MSADIVTTLLRDPASSAERCRRSEGLRELAATALVCLIGGAALFGAVMGAFRGGPQIAYSAFKLPLALLATLVISVPAFFSLTIALGGRTRFGAMATVSLLAAARGALVLAACAPLLWFAVDRGLDYHASVLLATLMYMVAGGAALELLLKGIGGAWRSLITAALCGVVFFAVLGQTAWMLRPFFGRPSQHAVPFVRTREGSFADAVMQSSKSAVGIYERVEARVEPWDSRSRYATQAVREAAAEAPLQLPTEADAIESERCLESIDPSSEAP